MTIQKIKSGRIPGQDPETYVGNDGQLFYDEATGILRISDGVTPGGTIVSGGSGSGSYTLPTATTTVKGGVKIDGTTINIANQVISVGTVPYSNISGKPTAVSAFTNDSGYVTSSSLSSYATQTYVTTRGYITSAGVPSAVSSFSNDSGYLTEDEFDLNTIDFDSNNNLHATGILPGDVDGFTAIFAGRAAGIAALPNTVIQSQAQVNDYAQNNFQNTFDGNHASTEWVATSPNGDDSNYYIDMGFTGAAWDGTAANSLYTNAGQRDGFLYVQGGNAGGGNLVLGTSLASTYTKIISGNASAGNTEVARFSSTEVKLSKQLTFSDNTTQTTAWTGAVSYNDLTDTPTLVTSYNDLTDLPTLITSYNELANLPTLFSGAYADLTGKPTLFSGSYNDLTDKPVTVQSLDDLTDVDLTTPPTIGQVLKYDGTKWAPGTDITAGGSGTDADTLDGFDSTYFLNYNNFTNKPTIPTTVTVNGTAITLGSSGTVTANTTNALTIGTGLKATASTFDGSAANTVTLDTTVTAIVATAGATTTLSAATLTPFYNITGTISGTHIIRLPDLTTLAAGTKITFNTAQGTLSFQLSTGTVIVSTAVALSRQIIFTVLSNAANTTANVYYTQTGLGMTGTGNNIVTSTSPVIVGAYITGLDSTTSTSAYASTPILTLGAGSNQFTQTINIANVASLATYTKTLNIGTGLAGGTSTINIGTGVTSGTATINIASSTTTTTMNGAVTITSLTATNSIVGSVTGNAATATKLGTARAINGVNFDGSAAITITAANPNALTIGTGLSGTSYDGSTGVTVAIDNTIALRADTTYVGTTSIALNRSSASQTLTGVSIDGNAATVTNGVYTTGTYANPTWISSLAYSKLTGTPSLFSGAYADLTGKPTVPSNVSQLTNDSGYITAAAIPAQFTFNVAADDSSLKTITSQETVKFIGANNITTSSDAEGNITITGPTLTSYVTLSGSQTLTSKNINGTNNTITNIANSSLTNSSVTVGTTAISLGSSSTTLGGMAWITFAGSTSGTTQLRPSAIAGTTTVTMPGTTGTLITTGDTGTVTNTMLAGSIANAKLANSAVTVNGTSISLGSSATVTAAAGTLTGTTLNSSVVTSSLTSVGTLTGLTVDSSGSTPVSITAYGRPGSETNNWSFVSNQSIGGPRAWIQFPDSTLQTTAWTGSVAYSSVTGTPTLATVATSGSYADLTDKPTIPTTVTVNGTSITLGSSGTVTAAAGTLTGTTLNSTVVSSSLTSVGTLTNLSVTNTITGAVSGNAGTATKLATARAINGVDFDGSAAITITAAAGTLSGSTLASGVTASSLTSVGTLTGVTSNAVTAFTAGDAAISGVALQVPREGAIRNLYNGTGNNMYFDVSIGGTSQGQFQFRSSSAFTNVLTMSPTAFNVNPEAVVTARTPSFGRLPWNSAIDTELIIDEYRFRVTNSGGIYPQIISNVSGQTKNSAWTAVAAISGQAIGQGGSTGTLVPNNAWTNLYTFAAMNAAGDTVTVTLQDKAQGRIYRITFMRSDNGSTTGYNIIAERLL